MAGLAGHKTPDSRLQRTDDGGQRTEGGGQRTDGGGWMAEGGGRTTDNVFWRVKLNVEYRMQNNECKSKKEPRIPSTSSGQVTRICADFLPQRYFIATLLRPSSHKAMKGYAGQAENKEINIFYFLFTND